ncbi:MAG: hypothetical protein WDN06_04680 [Asticcacaulis sp.]
MKWKPLLASPNFVSDKNARQNKKLEHAYVSIETQHALIVPGIFQADTGAGGAAGPATAPTGARDKATSIWVAVKPLVSVTIST